MMTKISLLFFLFTACAYGRLGESEDDMAKRWGKPTNDPTDQGVRHFVFGEWRIQVTIQGGKSGFEAYSHSDGRTFSDEDIQIVLGANSSGRQWNSVSKIEIWGREKEFSKAWALDNGNAIAWLETDARTLGIMTQSFNDSMTKKLKEERDKKIKASGL